jgi:hypothetical protein
MARTPRRHRKPNPGDTLSPSQGTLELDHLLYATPDVDATVAELEERFGVPFAGGGTHPGWGTRNRILPLGDRIYLEVIGPDEAQAGASGDPILEVDRLEAPSLRWWAIRPFLMPLTCGEFETAGFVPGQIVDGRRTLPDGSELNWTITDPHVRLMDGLIPLVIDWGTSTRHPGDGGTPGVSLAGLRLEHPEHERLSALFGTMGLPRVHPGSGPALIATFDTPKGPVELRS